jgi:DNA-binding response OmpR family regulator
MKKILIAGFRDDISKLYELLLWQDGRSFVRAKNVEQCLELVRLTKPDLIIVDSGIASLDGCHKLVVNLRRHGVLEERPILLICEPQKNNQIFNSLLDLVDGVLPLPFDAEEVKLKTLEYL